MTRAYSTVDLIDRHWEETSSSGGRGHLGASLIGAECHAQLWFGFRWALKEEHPGRLLRLFNFGHEAEATLVRYLEQAGVTVWDVDPETGDQFGVKPEGAGGHFAGSCDGVGIGFREMPQVPMLLEFKTSADKPFKEVVSKGVKEAKPQHWAQMVTYMAEMELTHAFYLVINKNTHELYAEIVEADPEYAASLVEKAKHIITSDRPPARMSEDPSFYKCKFCNFSDVCHKEAMPEVNCRTCIHSTPELDGDARWSCAKHGTDYLSIEDQRLACQEHVFIPDLLKNWATPIEASMDDNVISYENRANGHRVFQNGSAPGAFKSAELAKCIDKTVLGDPFVEAMKSQFGAQIEDPFEGDQVSPSETKMSDWQKKRGKR